METWIELVVAAVIFFFCVPEFWLTGNFWPLGYIAAGSVLLGLVFYPIGKTLDKCFPPKPPLPDSTCICGYDLHLNDSGICPECGKPVHAAVKERRRRKYDPDWWEAFVFWRK